MQQILNFASEQLNKGQDVHTYVGIMVLGTVLEGPNEADLATTFQGMYDYLLSLMSSEVYHIRYAALWVIRKVVQFLPTLVLKSDHTLNQVLSIVYTRA